MARKPASKRKRAIFEDVGAAAPPPAARVAPTGVIDARPGATRAGQGLLRLWFVVISVLVLAVLLAQSFLRLSAPDLAAALWSAPLSLMPPADAAAWAAEMARHVPRPVLQPLPSLPALGGPGTLVVPAEPAMALDTFRPLWWAGWGQALGAVSALGLMVLGWPILALAGKLPKGLGGRLSLVLALLLGLALLALGGTLGLLEAPVARLAAQAGLPADLGVSQWPLWPGFDAIISAVQPWLAAATAAGTAAVFTLLIGPALLRGRADVALLQARRMGERGLARWAGAAGWLLAATLVLGVHLTGLAGLPASADWPRMNGAFVPPEVLALPQTGLAGLADPVVLAFGHRALGYLVVLVALAGWLVARRSVHPVTRGAFLVMALGALLQASLGVLGALRPDLAPLPLVHLAAGFALLALVLRARIFALYPAVQSIRGRRR